MVGALIKIIDCLKLTEVEKYELCCKLSDYFKIKARG